PTCLWGRREMSGMAWAGPTWKGVARRSSRALSAPNRRRRSFVQLVIAFSFTASISIVMPSLTPATASGGPAELMLASAAPAADAPAPIALTADELAAAVEQASAEWLTVQPDADFGNVATTIADLPGLELGATQPGAAPGAFDL